MRVLSSKQLATLLGVLVIVASVGFASYHVWQSRPPVHKPVFGITFSTVYAKQLGLNWQAAYRALLDDVGVRLVRLPVYWSTVESQRDVYDWSELDWLVSESERRGASVTLVVGSKVPRWPECFIPDWAETLDIPHQQEEQLQMIEQTVQRYRSSSAVIRWQVENEAFLPFGICPRPDYKQFIREIDLVRSLDTRPVQITVSGEVEPWFDAAVTSDVLGISLYRLTWHDLYGYFYYPLTPLYYRIRAATMKPFVERVVISELQAEPWFPEPVSQRTPTEWYAAFDDKALRTNVEFAAHTGLDEAYLWGAEWWYFLKEHGEDRLWNVAKEIFVTP